MPIKFRTLALLTLGALALPAAADSYNPSWYGLAGVNVQEADHDWNTDKVRLGGGIKLGVPLSQSFDVQFNLSQGRNAEDDRKYHQTLFGADLLYLFSRNSVRPFLLAGLGGERDKLKTSLGENAKTAFSLDAGAGVQFFFTDRLFAQADARYVHGFLDDSTWGHKANGNGLYGLSVGYVFGGAPKAAPVVAPAPAVEAPAPVAEAPAPAPAPEPVFEKVTLSAAELFAFNKAELKADQPKLDEIAAVLGKNGHTENVSVSGYTDRLGSTKYNLALSKKRAEAVKTYLVSKGIAAERIETIGKGKADPVAACTGVKKRAALIECLAPNRRVEVAPITFTRRVK
jgi:OOP family OmpA-OmpF porin